MLKCQLSSREPLFPLPSMYILAHLTLKLRITSRQRHAVANWRSRSWDKELQLRYTHAHIFRKLRRNWSLEWIKSQEPTPRIPKHRRRGVRFDPGLRFEVVIHWIRDHPKMRRWHLLRETTSLCERTWNGRIWTMNKKSVEDDEEGIVWRYIYSQSKIWTSNI